MSKELPDNYYVYKFHEERGDASMSVENNQGKIVWEWDNSNPENTSPTEDGFMKHTEDITGLERHLKTMRVIDYDDTIISEKEANQKYSYYEQGGKARRGGYYNPELRQTTSTLTANEVKAKDITQELWGSKDIGLNVDERKLLETLVENYLEKGEFEPTLKNAGIATEKYGRLFKNNIIKSEPYSENFSRGSLISLTDVEQNEVENAMGLIFKKGGGTDYRASRPSPSDSATMYNDGYEMVGNDGNIWKVAVTGRGIHRWVKKKAEGEEEVPNYKLITDNIKAFFPPNQLEIIGDALRGEEMENFREILITFDKRINQMPVTYETSKIPAKDKIVWLHYFSGGANWYIAEKDKGDGDDKTQTQAYGYADLGEGEGEWGYISIEELKGIKSVELDLYFEPKKFSQISGDVGETFNPEGEKVSVYIPTKEAEEKESNRDLAQELQNTIASFKEAGMSDQSIENSGTVKMLRKQIAELNKKEDVKATQTYTEMGYVKPEIKQEKPKMESVQTPTVIGKLKANGFINDDLSLTNKGKRIVELHKFCFPMDAHPFSHIYYEPSDLYQATENAFSLAYVIINEETLYTNGTNIFEAGKPLDTNTKNRATHNIDLQTKLANTISKDNIVYIPYAYCPGVSVTKAGVETGPGFMVFHNLLNNIEIYVNSMLYNYIIKNYNVNSWAADKDNPELVRALDANGRTIAYLRASDSVIGLYASFSLFDKEKLFNGLKQRYAKAFMQGISYQEFVKKAESMPEPVVILDEDIMETIKGLELMIELADNDEERNMYVAEIKKIKPDYVYIAKGSFEEWFNENKESDDLKAIYQLLNVINVSL